MSFSLQVAKFTEQTAPATINRQMRGIVEELFDNIIQGTPIGEGRLASNWQPSSKAPASGEIDEIDVEGTKRKSKDFVSKFDFSKGNFAVYLTNNLDYARIVEFGLYPKKVKRGTKNRKTKKYEILTSGGFSKKAPKGMVRKNLIAMSQKIKSRVS